MESNYLFVCFVRINVETYKLKRMFDSILHSWHFRDGFSSLLNGDSSDTASQEATQESTSQQETHIDGGRVQRSTVYVRSDRLAMKVSAWFAGVRILSENAAACLLKYQRWNAAENDMLTPRMLTTEGSSTS